MSDQKDNPEDWNARFAKWAGQSSDSPPPPGPSEGQSSAPPPPPPQPKVESIPPSDFSAYQKKKKAGGGPPNPPKPPANPTDWDDLLKKLRPLLVFGLIIYVLFNSFYTVGPDEQAVVLRLGQYSPPFKEPGMHFKIPFGVDMVYRAKVKYTFKEEFGYRTIEAGQRSTLDGGNYSYESLHVTGDLDIVDIQWSLHYRIVDPKLYLFHTRNLTETIRFASEVAMREVVGDHSFDEAAIKSRNEVEVEAKRATNKMLDAWKTGVTVVNLKLRHSKPPQKVEGAFNEVNEARQEMVKVINEGQAEYNKAVPAARGKAQRLIEEAEGYRQERINLAQGEVSRFNKLLKEYQANKVVMRKRLHLETLQEILPKTKKKIFVSDNQGDTLKFLNLRGEKSPVGENQ